MRAACSVCGKPTDCESERGSGRSYYCSVACLNVGRENEPTLAGFYEKSRRMSAIGKKRRSV